jgi:hypothetical protein
MHRRQILTGSAAVATGLALAASATAQTADDESQASFATVMAFMGAMGGGDRDGMGTLMSSLVLCEVPSGSNVTGLTVQNNTVTCSPEGTAETDFRILRTTQDVTLDGSRVEGNKARALEPYSGAVVDIPFIGTSGVDPKNFTMDAGQSNHINGVLWFQLDVAGVVAVRSGAIGNQFSLDIRNARSGAARPQAWGVIAEPDQATDRNPNSTKFSIELLATAPTVSTDATAGSIGVHFSRSTGLATFANNQGNAQTLGLRMSG